MLRKVFKPARVVHWTILEKEVVDEIITEKDVDGRKLTLVDPKTGKEGEVVLIPQKVADRLNPYKLCGL